MSGAPYLLWHDGAPAIASTRRLFSAAEVPMVEEARELCERLAAQQVALDARAQKVLAGARDEGFAAGLAQGRAAAMAAVAEAVEAMTGAMGISRDQAVAAAREDVALLALQVARKLIGQLPEAEQLARLAQEAARQSMPDGEALRLRVHPSHEAEVRALLAATVGAAHWRVEGDAALPVTACRVGGARGDVDAAIDVQLARVARGWGLEWPSGRTREDPLPRPLPQAGEGVIQPAAGGISSQAASAISLPLPLAGEGGGEGLPVPPLAREGLHSEVRTA